MIQTIREQLKTQLVTEKKPPTTVYNAAESLLQKDFINTLTSQFIVLLIQKRISDAKEVIEQLNSWIQSNVDLDDDVNDYVMSQRQTSEGCMLIVQNHSKQGPQFLSFAQNILPMYQDLYVCVKHYSF